MISIRGKVEEIRKDRVLAPNDGIHDKDANGYVRGARAYTLNGKLLPRGMVGFYYRLNEDKGIKVYYGFKKDHVTPLETVKRCRRNMTKLATMGLALMPEKIVPVFVEFDFGGRKIKRNCFGIVVKHVHFPETIWTDYISGKTYAWPEGETEHSPMGLVRFREKIANAVQALGLKIDARGKLGDVLYDTKRKRWILVDCG